MCVLTHYLSFVLAHMLRLTTHCSYDNSHGMWHRRPLHPWGFIHLDLDGQILKVGEMLLSEEPPPWLGILAKSSLVSECVERACVR